MKTTLTIKGMHCASCETLITEELLEQGATTATANHTQGTLEVEHDTTLSVQAIKNIIKQEGYEVLE
jgi:copper chaperone CopZ